MSLAPGITVPLRFHFGIFCFNILPYLCTLAQPASRGQSPVPMGWFYTCFLSTTAGLLYPLVSHLWIPFIQTQNLCFPLDIFSSLCPRQHNISVYAALPCVGTVKMTLNIWEDVCTYTVCPGTRDLSICRLWCLWALLESPGGNKGCTRVSRFNVMWRTWPSHLPPSSSLISCMFAVTWETAHLGEKLVTKDRSGHVLHSLENM